MRCHPTGVTAGHSRPKDGVASLAYGPAIHERVQQTQIGVYAVLQHRMDPRVTTRAGGATECSNKPRRSRE
jgi:hypothetical protein